MHPSLLAIRSLAVEFIMRLYGPVVILVAVISVSLLGFSVWLTTLSDAWWILFGLLAIVALVVVTVLAVLWNIIRWVAPKRTKQQKRQAKALVDKIQHLTEVAATPKFFLWFQVVRDIFSPSQKGFIASVSDDTTSLQRDFAALVDSFR